MIKAKLILLGVVISIPSFASDFPFFKRNGFKNKLRTGLWVTYWDTSNTIRESKGRYKNGNERGVWRYFFQDGKLREKEAYRFQRIRTTTYFPNGKIESKGYAKLIKDGNNLHYYRYGEWKKFSEDGKLCKIVIYEKGMQVGEKIITPILNSK